MYINDYFWPKYGTNLKKSLDKHEANSLYSQTTKSGSTLLNHSRNGKKWTKLKSQQGMKLLELSTLGHKRGEYHHFCFMLTLFWTISAAKNSVTFICHFHIHCHLHMHNPLATSLLHVPVKYNDA
jgi:hypothetical protein